MNLFSLLLVILLNDKFLFVLKLFIGVLYFLYIIISIIIGVKIMSNNVNLIIFLIYLNI